MLVIPGLLEGILPRHVSTLSRSASSGNAFTVLFASDLAGPELCIILSVSLKVACFTLFTQNINASMEDDRSDKL